MQIFSGVFDQVIEGPNGLPWLFLRGPALCCFTAANCRNTKAWQGRAARPALHTFGSFYNCNRSPSNAGATPGGRSRSSAEWSFKWVKWVRKVLVAPISRAAVTASGMLR